MIDLGRDDGMHVEITKDGVNVKKTEVCFYRPVGTGELPIPIVPTNNGDSNLAINKLYWALGGHHDERTRASFHAFLIAALRPQGPYPNSCGARRTRQRQDDHVPHDADHH